MMPKPNVPKPPPPPKMPQSPFDNPPIKGPDETASAFSSLISTSPTGVKKAANITKKTLLGGAK